MATKGGCIDFMFLTPPLPGHWIRYCAVRVLCGYRVYLYTVYHIVRYVYAVMPLFYLGCMRERITLQKC